MRAITLRSRLLTKALGAFSRSGVESATEVGQRPTPPPLRVRPRLSWGCLRGRTLSTTPKAPTMPVRLCRRPGCGNPPDGADGRCARHRRRELATHKARHPWTRAYGDPDFRQARSRLQGQPCAQCGQPAQQIDHITPLADLWETDRWPARHQPQNLQPLCLRCHTTKTRQQQTQRKP